MTTARGAFEVLRRFTWPFALVGGLLVVAFSLVPWGRSDEGVRPSVSGLGRVSVPGAQPEDVAFLEEHTLRPGLITVVLGAVIVLFAAIGWWQPRVRWVTLAAIAIACAVSFGTAVVVLADPAGHLFDARVNEALDSSTPLLSPAYGPIGVLVVSVVVAAVMIVEAVDRRGRPQRRPVVADAPTEEVTPGGGSS
ncbi:hypothetical protein AAFP35_21215 [Gordonia sp. CPCC 206044]|uniref:hypothetical protein n=1 Tax=Gordonia sp. CPCC 206044 TaxID=3140793 RepID=UPI003AF3CCCA